LNSKDKVVVKPSLIQVKIACSHAFRKFRNKLAPPGADPGFFKGGEGGGGEGGVSWGAESMGVCPLD